MARIISITIGEDTRELDLDSLLISEAKECQRLTGMKFHEWEQEFIAGDATAIAYAWWLACKRAGEPVAGPFADLDFDLGQTVMRRVEPDAQPEEADADLPTGPPEAAVA